MSDTQNYAIWKPEHDGHAPPNWRKGMDFEFKGRSTGWRLPNPKELPSWMKALEYRVPSEALTAPNEDDAAFDVAIWLEQGRANLDKLPEGVVLPEPKDWATELWADLLDAWDGGSLMSTDDHAAIELLRERVVLKEGL